MAEVTVEAEGLTKRFGPRGAVTDVSFTARRGEIVGLLGPNGAGKTTTIRLLTTVLTPTSGQFSVAGVPSTRPAEIRQRVGVLPESSGYPEHQTGAEYLRYHARLYGLARSDAVHATERLLTEVGLADRATSRIATYSRGMRQRLGIARAVVNDPVVVFLDEPTLGLDPAGQRQALALIRDIAQRRGATVVLSTHTLSEVEEVCTRVLILNQGKIVAAGSVSDVTQTAAAPRSGRLRVPSDQVGRAKQALSDVGGLRVEATEERPDILNIWLSDGHVDMNAALQAVLRVGVQVLSFETQGARLGDAFLTITDGGV